MSPTPSEAPVPPAPASGTETSVRRVTEKTYNLESPSIAAMPDLTPAQEQQAIALIQKLKPVSLAPDRPFIQMDLKIPGASEDQALLVIKYLQQNADKIGLTGESGQDKSRVMMKPIASEFLRDAQAKAYEQSGMTFDRSKFPNSTFQIFMSRESYEAFAQHAKELPTPAAPPLGGIGVGAQDRIVARLLNQFEEHGLTEAQARSMVGPEGVNPDSLKVIQEAVGAGKKITPGMLPEALTLGAQPPAAPSALAPKVTTPDVPVDPPDLSVKGPRGKTLTFIRPEQGLKGYEAVKVSLKKVIGDFDTDVKPQGLREWLLPLTEHEGKEARRFNKIRSAISKGELDMPELRLGHTGRLGSDNGNHRLTELNRMGFDEVFVLVPKEDAAKIRERYGAEDSAPSRTAPLPAVKKPKTMPIEPETSPAAPEKTTAPAAEKLPGLKPPPRMSIGGALLGSAGRAMMIKGIIDLVENPSVPGAVLTAGGAAQEGAVLGEALLNSRVDALAKAARAAKALGNDTEAVDLAARAASGAKNASALAKTAKVLGVAMGPLNAGMEVYSATEAKSPVSKGIHLGLAGVGLAETGLVAAGAGGPLAPVLLVGSAGAALTVPILEAWQQNEESNADMLGGTASQLNLGREPGVKAEKLPPRFEEFTQLSRVADKFKEKDPEKLRVRIEEEIATIKASPAFRDSNNIADLRVQQYEGALKELGSREDKTFTVELKGVKGETLTAKLTDLVGAGDAPKTETFPTYASRYYAAQEAAARDPDRMKAVTTQIERLIGREARMDIGKSLAQEQAELQKEFAKLAKMETGDREKYLKTNAEFLKENGIPRHSALSGALVTYDNILEKAAFAGVDLKASGMEIERAEALKSTGIQYREVIGKLKEKGAIAEIFTAGKQTVVAFKGDYLTPEDRMSVMQMATQLQTRGMGNLLLLEDATPEQLQGIKTADKEAKKARFDKGRDTMETLLEDMTKKKPPFVRALRVLKNPQDIVRRLESSDDIEKSIATLLDSGDERAIKQAAHYYGIGDKLLREAGIPVDAVNAQNATRFKDSFSQAFHKGQLTAEELEGGIQLGINGAQRELVPVYAFRGTPDEVKAFQQALTDACVDSTISGNTLEGQVVRFKAEDVAKMVPPELSRVGKIKTPTRAEAKVSGGRMEAVLKQIDRDGDKKITARDFDLNGDGKLSIGEQKLLQDAYQKITNPLTLKLSSQAALEAIDAVQNIAKNFGVKLADSPDVVSSAGLPGNGPRSKDLGVA
jgi:hypothetical protein